MKKHNRFYNGFVQEKFNNGEIFSVDKSEAVCRIWCVGFVRQLSLCFCITLLSSLVLTINSRVEADTLCFSQLCLFGVLSCFQIFLSFSMCNFSTVWLVAHRFCFSQKLIKFNSEILLLILNNFVLEIPNSHWISSQELFL